MCGGGSECLLNEQLAVVSFLRAELSVLHMGIIVVTLLQSGGYILGFRIDPPDKLQEVGICG